MNYSSIFFIFSVITTVGVKLGWGGTLISSTAANNGRPNIAFEYSPEAIQRGVELSSYLLPLKGLPFRQGFPTHQMGLPGPVYDALPDG